MEKLLIVDGAMLLFQSFYGMPKKILNKRGESVEAVVCFLGILFKIIRSINPDKLLIVFDGENQLKRQQIDENYKANRKDFSNTSQEKTPFPQLEIIKVILKQLNFLYIETTTCEADDLIASIVNDNKNILNIVISSQDKDFFQLIDDNVSVFSYRGKVSVHWDKQTFFTKYGFEPKYFSTYKALFGDKSDNISGIKGFGHITTSKIIKSYGDIFDIYKNINLIDAKLAKILSENKQKVLKNFSLIELHSKSKIYSLPNCTFNFDNNMSSSKILKELDIL